MAEILAKHNVEHGLVQEIASMFQEDNPRFDEKMFFAYFMECQLLNHLKTMD